MRLILDIINFKWSDVIGQIHLSMWQYTIIEWFLWYTFVYVTMYTSVNIVKVLTGMRDIITITHSLQKFFTDSAISEL